MTFDLWDWFWLGNIKIIWHLNRRRLMIGWERPQRGIRRSEEGGIKDDILEFPAGVLNRQRYLINDLLLSCLVQAWPYCPLKGWYIFSWLIFYIFLFVIPWGRGGDYFQFIAYLSYYCVYTKPDIIFCWGLYLLHYYLYWKCRLRLGVSFKRVAPIPHPCLRGWHKGP